MMRQYDRGRRVYLITIRLTEVMHGYGNRLTLTETSTRLMGDLNEIATRPHDFQLVMDV